MPFPFFPWSGYQAPTECITREELGYLLGDVCVFRIKKWNSKNSLYGEYEWNLKKTNGKKRRENKVLYT